MNRNLTLAGLMMLLAALGFACSGSDGDNNKGDVITDLVNYDAPFGEVSDDTVPGVDVPMGELGEVAEILADTTPDTINNAPYFAVGPCDPPAAGFANLKGEVRDSFGGIVSGAGAVFSGGLTGDIDGYGRFYLCSVPAGEKTSVMVKLPRTLMWGSFSGYAPTSKTVTPADGDELLLAFRLKMASFLTFDETAAAAGGEASDGTTKVLFPAAAFVDANGAAHTGPVNIQVTTFDSGDPEDLESFPGDFAGVDGETQVGLFSLGFVDVQLFDADENPLQLAGGKPATLSFKLANLDPADTTIPMWYFDETTGTWIREGDGTVNQIDGTITATVAHFTTWNADKPVTLTDCVKGVVQDQDAQPLVGAAVYGTGQGSGTSGAGGAFCLNFYPGATFQIRGSLISDGNLFKTEAPYTSYTGIAAGGQNCNSPDLCATLPEPVTLTYKDLVARCLNITLTDATEAHTDRGTLTINQGELGVVYSGKMNGLTSVCVELMAGMDFSAQLNAMGPDADGNFQEAFCFPKTFNGSEIQGGTIMGSDPSTCGGTCDELVMECKVFGRGPV
jgi:hypothetical protein